MDGGMDGKVIEPSDQVIMNRKALEALRYIPFIDAETMAMLLGAMIRAINQDNSTRWAKEAACRMSAGLDILVRIADERE
jgi:hypothetical protein